MWDPENSLKAASLISRSDCKSTSQSHLKMSTCLCKIILSAMFSIIFLQCICATSLPLSNTIALLSVFFTYWTHIVLCQWREALAKIIDLNLRDIFTLSGFWEFVIHNDCGVFLRNWNNSERLLQCSWSLMANWPSPVVRSWTVSIKNGHYSVLEPQLCLWPSIQLPLQVPTGYMMGEWTNLYKACWCPAGNIKVVDLLFSTPCCKLQVPTNI